VELHRPYDHDMLEGERLGVPYEARFEREGWEFRLKEHATRGDAVVVHVEFVCSECLARERRGNQVVGA
jgi:hypothetical protein